MSVEDTDVYLLERRCVSKTLTAAALRWTLDGLIMNRSTQALGCGVLCGVHRNTVKVISTQHGAATRAAVSARVNGANSPKKENGAGAFVKRSAAEFVKCPCGVTKESLAFCQTERSGVCQKARRQRRGRGL